MEKYSTNFAIVNMDNTLEYKGISKDSCGRKSICFTKEKGKRYKIFSNAIATAVRLNEMNGYPICKVIETYL